MWVNSIFTLVEVSGLLIIIGVGLSIGSVADTNYFEMPSVAYLSHTAIISSILASTCLYFLHITDLKIFPISLKKPKIRREQFLEPYYFLF